MIKKNYGMNLIDLKLQLMRSRCLAHATENSRVALNFNLIDKLTFSLTKHISVLRLT